MILEAHIKVARQ